MSIAASENAGLGPCELPDRWAASSSNTTTKSSTSATETDSYCTKSSDNLSTNFVPISKLSATNTIKTNNTFSSACRKTTATADFGSTNSNNICNLQHLSPASAIAAVTISNSASTLLGLAPVAPISTGVVPLHTTTTTIAASIGGRNAVAPSSLIANNNNETVTTESSNNNSSTPTANVLARFSSLQQQQAYFFSNNNSLLSINNLLPLHLQYQQRQYSSLHKAATTASNIAAALQRSVNMNAVASPISANSTTSNRKVRRKNDSKANLPQSQINKCNNEKRRRELENNYIEQLSEFLQLNKRGDMTSTKPDKAAILNQVVKTYRDICDRGQSRDISSCTSSSTGTTITTSSTTITTPASVSTANNNNNNQSTSTRCSRCATDNCLIHPVQQGDVSSTEPPLPEPSLLNGQVPEISAYFEALEHYISSVGWVLLQVNSTGIIESCTQNIRELIGYEKQELYRQPLYMYLYPGDHAKLDPILNMSTSLMSGGNSGPGNGGTHDINTAWNIGVDSENPNRNSGKQERSNSTKVRMLVKEMRISAQNSGSSSSTNNDNNLMDQTPKYEEVVLMAASVKDDSDSSSVLCLITRPEDESPSEMNIQQHVQHPSIEQVTFKLDIHGKIITLDATTLREPFKLHLSQWSGRLLQDLCHPQDLTTLKTHLRDIQDSNGGLNAINVSQSPGSGVGINPPIFNVTSKPFRLRLGAPDIYVHVKANSRLFINSTPGESDFIMSVQTLLNTENDVNTDTIVMMSGNSGQNNTGAAISPGSSLVSSLVSNLSMDTFANTNSVSSPIINVSSMGGLVGGGGIPTNTTQTTNVGGPLMTSAVTNGAGSVSNDTGGGPVLGSNNSVINSQRTGYAIVGASTVVSNNSALVNSFAASPTGNEGPSFYSNEFDLDLPHSSFEIDPSVSAWNDSRPNSRASVTTPVSTPRPPSTGHGFSPAICPSPSTPYQTNSAPGLSSPQSNTSQSGTGTVGAQGSINYGFQSFENNTEKNENDSLNKNNNASNSNSMPAGSSTNSTGNLSNGVNQLIFGNIGAKASATNSQQKKNEAHQLHNTKPPTESERLRHLLTNKSHSAAITSLMDGDDIKLYKLEEDKESLASNISGTYKIGQNVGHGGMGTSRMFGMQKNSNSNNPMLLSLLKSEDDEKGSPSMGRSGDMGRIKDEHHGSHGNVSSNPNNLSPEDLRRILKHQGDPAMTRKRSLNDSDDGLLAKRSDDRPSKLCETNKMLASLLRNPPKNITMKIQTGIKIIPDKVPTAVGRVSTTQSGLNSATIGSCNTSIGLTPISIKSSTVTAITGSISSSTASRGRGQQKQAIHTPSDVYLNQHQQGLDGVSSETSLQRPTQMFQKSQGQIEFSSSPSTVNHSFATPPLNTTAPSITATSTSSATIGTSLACVGDGDSELSKILDSVMDYVSDDQPFTPTTPIGLTPQQINERMAISEIQKSLMVETSAFRNCPNVMITNPATQQMLQQQMQQHQQHPQLQPPAYPGSIMTTAGGSNSSSMTPQQQQMQMMRMQQMLETMRANQNFQRPPPNYPARGRTPLNTVATSGVSVISATQRYRSLAQQQIVQQQKERLLQQQQKQHMLVPENATARNDHLCLNPNIGTLLNTVAPNVTLSRTNMIPESQLSPNFAQNMLQQQLSPGQRNSPFNPQSNSGYGQQYPQSGQRLSPQQHLSQQTSNQQQIAFQSGNAAQLSPRQPHFSNQLSNNTGNTGVTSPSITQNASPQQWQTQSPINGQQRGHSLQQHNPMLSAQLQGVSPYNNRQYQQQRGRNLNSPSGSSGQVVQGSSQGPGSSSMQRQNTFQANDGSSYTSTQNSPASQASFSGSGNFQQNQSQQIQRMQRPTTVSQAAQLMPAGNPASSDYVKQELRAVVSGRAAAAATATTIISANGPGEPNLSGSLRVTTPQSSHVPQTPQGAMIGANSTNSMVITPQQQPHASITASNASNNLVSGSNASAGSGVGNITSGLINTPPDPTVSFGFGSQDFFGSSAR